MINGLVIDMLETLKNALSPTYMITVLDGDPMKIS